VRADEPSGGRTGGGSSVRAHGGRRRPVRPKMVSSRSDEDDEEDDVGTEPITGAHDEQYDLISVLYHATQGAWNYDHYIKDAEDQGDQELADFIRDVRDKNAEVAKRAKELLRSRL
jgi:hypothetical protein